MTSNQPFSNEHYYILVLQEPYTYKENTYPSCYGVVHKDTKVIEYKSPSLIDCIQFACDADAALLTEAWKPIYTRYRNATTQLDDDSGSSLAYDS